MRLIVIIPFIFALAACSIKSNVPDYEYPAASDASGTDWPKLANTADLEAAGLEARANAQNNQKAAARLAARARALRAKAARLRSLTTSG